MPGRGAWVPADQVSPVKLRTSKSFYCFCWRWVSCLFSNIQLMYSIPVSQTCWKLQCSIDREGTKLKTTRIVLFKSGYFRAFGGHQRHKFWLWIFTQNYVWWQLWFSPFGMINRSCSRKIKLRRKYVFSYIDQVSSLCIQSHFHGIPSSQGTIFLINNVSYVYFGPILPFIYFCIYFASFLNQEKWFQSFPPCTTSKSLSIK